MAVGNPLRVAACMVCDALSVRWRCKSATIRLTSMPPYVPLLGLALWIGVGWQLARAADFADPTKVLRVSMDGEEAGFDPQAIGDTYSFTVTTAIFEPPYQYDYYGGPRIVPRTAEDLPEISADG